MPTFRSLHNPDFKLWSHSFKGTIVFSKGKYTTEDPDEIKALRRNQAVEEVEEKQEAPKPKPQKQQVKRGGALPKGGQERAHIPADTGGFVPPGVVVEGERPKVRVTFDPNDRAGS